MMATKKLEDFYFVFRNRNIPNNNPSKEKVAFYLLTSKIVKMWKKAKNTF